MKNKTIIITVIFVLLSGLPFLKVKDIMLISPKQSNSQILENAFNELLNKNIFFVYIDKFRFKKKILNQFPSIKDFSFWLSPNLSLSIHIYFKTARFLSVSNNSTDILSLDGTRLNNHETLASLEHIQDLLIIKGLDPSLLSKNPHILNKINKLHTTMLNQLPSRNLQLDFSNPYNLVIIVNDSVPIHIGDSLDLDTKLENLTTFLDYTKLRFTDISYFDLRKKNSVIIKKQLN